MVDGLSIQNTITSILTRDDLKKSGEISHYVSDENDYGENTKTFDYQEVIEGIVLNYQNSRKKYDSAGLYKDSSLIFLIPATTVIDQENDTITISDIEYNIVNVTSPAFVGEYLTHKILFLRK